MNRPDFAGGAIGTVLSAWVIVEAAGFPPDIVMKIGPGFFPILLAGALLFFSVVLMVGAALKAHPAGAAAPDMSPGLLVGPLRAVLTVAAVLLYCLALKTLGFILVSLAFLIAMMLLLGERHPLVVVGASAAVTAGVFVVFEKLLGLTLPAGVLEDLLY